MAPSFVRNAVASMDGYTPGEQPRPGQRVIKLNTNENPFAPSPRVLQAIRDIEPEMLRRYPDPFGEQFRAAAGKLAGFSPEHILCGNGSDDILSIAIRTFLNAGDTIVCPDPTYSLYPVLSQIQDARFVAVPFTKDWDLPIDALLHSNPRAIFLANPNAPSGTFVPPARIRELLSRFDGALLVDEAYVDFADESCAALVREFPRLVISRTLSKSYSLAGLRFGYAIAQPLVIEQMMKVKDSYNVDAISVVAATAAIEDQEYARNTWAHVRAERERLSAALRQMGWDVLPSQANFILAAPPDGAAKAAYLGLKQQGILVRYFDKPGLRDKLRITVGQSQETNAVIGGLKSLASSEKAA